MSIFFETVVDEWGTTYVPTTLGYGTLIAIMVLLLLGACFVSGKKSAKVTTKQLVFSAMAMALGVLLSMVKIELPMGGSFTLLSMLLICLVGYWYGLRAGIMTAIAYGFLQLIIDPYVIHPLQMMMDYIFAFGALGLSGVFSKSKHGLLKGYWLGITVRFLFSYISGMIYFGYAAEEYNLAVPIYSALYNGSYIFAEAILTTVIILIPPVEKALARIKLMATSQLPQAKQKEDEERKIK